MITLDEFLASGLSLLIYRDNNEVFRSESSDLDPLIEYIDLAASTSDGVIIFDKYVGRASALLMSMIDPGRVYTGVVSEGGAQALEEFGIPYYSQRQVKYLMEVASENTCKWEKLSLGKSPEEFLAEVRLIKSR